jgi:precorrin-6A/cobalt-precorrin-6A reductase
VTAHVLILAGTAEARELAEEVARLPGLRVTASLAGVTSTPVPMPVPTRTGGFGGAEGLAAWLREHRIAAVIDATHPFAERMAANAAAACDRTGVPRLKLLRPAWQPVGHWRPLPGLAAAAAALPRGARPLLTTGRKDLGPFLARPDLSCLLRVIEPVPDLPGHIEQVVARPPYDLDAELVLMRRQSVTHLVVKNAGGAGRAKLEAAARLGLPILVVERPEPPPGPRAASVCEALSWLRGVLAT